MSKKMKVMPPKSVIKDKSVLNFHGYIADKGGCGHIRMIFPFLYVNVER